MKQITIDAYSFDELDIQAKDVARNNMRNGDGPDEFEFKFVTDDAEKILEMLGVENVDIQWAGFSSQGDGASFTGSWKAALCMPGAVAQHAPKDGELQEIATRIESFANKYPTANVNLSRISFSYVHEHMIHAELIMEWEGEEAVLDSETDQAKEISRAFQNLMRWIYRQLEEVNDYWYSQENIDALLSQLTFTKGGSRSVWLPYN
jgi:hypothetical protein